MTDNFMCKGLKHVDFSVGDGISLCKYLLRHVSISCKAQCLMTVNIRDLEQQNAVYTVYSQTILLLIS